MALLPESVDLRRMISLFGYFFPVFDKASYSLRGIFFLIRSNIVGSSAKFDFLCAVVSTENKNLFSFLLSLQNLSDLTLESEGEMGLRVRVVPAWESSLPVNFI